LLCVHLGRPKNPRLALWKLTRRGVEDGWINPLADFGEGDNYCWGGMGDSEDEQLHQKPVQGFCARNHWHDV
jgi:hypothetical protein